MSDQKEDWEIGYSRENPMPKPDERELGSFRSASLVGQVVDGRFLIEKDLSEAGADQGGIGLVYLAQDLKLLNKRVVVKILQKAALENDDLVRKFLHEKEALIRLEHPNVVRILDTGSLSDGNPFIVMEFVPGYSLRKKMESGPLPLDFVAHVVESVTDALELAHSNGIIHRDIKPENIMLTPQDGTFERVRLIDFGIARVEESRLAPTTEVPRGLGTVRYIAPEQLAGSGTPTPAIDLYSFGIVVYEMITGERPFDPQTTVEMFLLQREGVKTPPSSLRVEVRPAAERLLVSALAFEPADRPAGIKEFGRALASALRSSGNAVRPATDSARPVAPDDPLPTRAAYPSAEIETAGRGAESAQIVFDAIERRAAEQKRPDRGRSWPLLAALILLLLTGTLGFVGWKVFWRPGDVAQVTEPAGDKPRGEKLPANGSGDSTANASKPDASPRTDAAAGDVQLSFYFSGQKTAADKPVGDPFRTSGTAFLEDGNKYRLSFGSSSAGFLYAFAEDGSGFNILFPTPKTNGGSAKVGADRTEESGWNTFRTNGSGEIIWLFWSKEPSADLENARAAAFENAGRIDGRESAALRKLIDRNAADASERTTDADASLFKVRGRGDVLVHKFEMEQK